MTRYVRAYGPGKVVLALFAISLMMVAATATAQAYDHTSKLEAERVDSVPAPAPEWEACLEIAECATYQVPLDYDSPKGTQVELALLKIPAQDPEEKIGSLFVNPGGPGAGAREFALAAPSFLGPDVLDHFDIIGMDPRGVGGSSQVRCFGSFEERFGAWLSHFTSSGFPATTAEEEAEMEAAQVIGEGCSTTGQPIVSSMSTAEVARDMDVLRRAVGDEKLTYYGVSYGTYLGAVYANMFPDRVRALTIDGVVDPKKWVGNQQNKYKPIFDRERSADAAYKVLKKFLRLCSDAGQPTCKFAGGDLLKKYGTLAKRVRNEPVLAEFGGYGEVPPFGTVEVNYNLFVQLTRLSLDYQTGWESLDAFLSSLWTLTGEEAGPSARAAARRSLSRAVTTTIRKDKTPRRGLVTELTPEEEELEASMSFEESLTSVLCTDALHGSKPSIWRVTGALAELRAPYFGRVWNYADTPCATSVWTAHDEDAYLGPFNRQTANPVLITSGYWDPATNYENAVSTWQTMPNSRLIANNAWGHGTYWTSECAANTIDDYLVTAVPPPLVTHCKGAIKPFESTASISRKQRSGVAPSLPHLGMPNPVVVQRRN